MAVTLQQQGTSAALLSESLLESPEVLAQEIVKLRQMYGAVTGIIHLASCATIPAPHTLTEWRRYAQLHSKSLFHLLKLCGDDLKQAETARVVAASFLGGYLGRNGHCEPGLATGGSSLGLLKTLVKELPEVWAKAIDFDESLSPQEMAQVMIKELMLPGGRIEVGYPQGTRTIFKTVSAPLDCSKQDTSFNLQPSKDWVVLITGGARGITAEIASELVVPGMTLILVGRSPEPLEESPLTAGITDIAGLRNVLLEQARTQGLSMTPVQMERQVQGVLRDRAIRLNLEQLRQAGAKVEYLAIDVRNEAAFGSLIDGIYSRHGRLDAVIHGAGVIEDKLIADKTATSFDTVFDTKVDSTFILTRHLRSDSLKLVVLFSSVAGRYGNRGQSDYASANEVMNRLAWQMDQQWPNTRVVAINWGPWDSLGMASDAVKQKFKEQGIIPISLAVGRQFFTEELRYGRKGETEIIAGEAPWEAREASQGQLQIDNQVLPVSSGKKFVLLSSQPQLQPNSTVTLEHIFSLANDPYLQDHCLDGKAVLPATAALEWMAEFVQSAWPEWTVCEVQDLRVLRGLVVETEEGRNALFQARASSHADAESLQVTVEILDPDKKIALYRASIILRPELLEPPTVQSIALPSGIGLDPAVAYHDYLFHGQRFQLVTAIERINEDGIDAYVMPSQPAAWSSSQHRHLYSTVDWLFDPALLDTVTQMALVWSRILQGSSALPSRFGRVVRYGRSRLNSQLNMAFRVKTHDEHIVVYDAVLVDESGNIRFHLQEVESTCSAALNRLNTQWRAANGFPRLDV